MPKEILSTRDDFDNWLVSVDDFLDSFLASQPQEVRQQLDFGPQSLDVVEAIILKTYPDTKAMLKSDQSRLVNWLAVYIGETFRKSLGGTWDICLDDPTFAFAGMPILVGGPFQGTPECPLTLATAAADRREGSYLRAVLKVSNDSSLAGFTIRGPAPHVPPARRVARGPRGEVAPLCHAT